MSLKACGINPALGLSPQRRELKPQGTLDFPCAGYAEHYAPDPAHSLPWHWHDEFEVIYILSGQLTPGTLLERLFQTDVCRYGAVYQFVKTLHPDFLQHLRIILFRNADMTVGKSCCFHNV